MNYKESMVLGIDFNDLTKKKVYSAGNKSCGIISVPKEWIGKEVLILMINRKENFK